MRYFTSILFLAVAVAVAVYDTLHDGSVMVFPFLGNLFPSLREQPSALGLASAGVLALFGLLLFAVRWLGRPKRPPAAG
jgi:hypothetical protein